MESSCSLETGCYSAEQFRKEMEYAGCSGRHDICNRVSANMFIDFLHTLKWNFIVCSGLEQLLEFQPQLYAIFKEHIQRASLKTHFFSHRGNCLLQYCRDPFNSSAGLGGIGHRCFWVMLQRGDEFNLLLRVSDHQYLA